MGYLAWSSYDGKLLYVYTQILQVQSRDPDSFPADSTLFSSLTFPHVWGLCGKVLVVGELWEWLSEKLLGASPVSNRAGASQLQNGPLASAGHKAYQWNSPC